MVKADSINKFDVSFHPLPLGIPPKNNGVKNEGNRLLFPFLLKISSCKGEERERKKELKCILTFNRYHQKIYQFYLNQNCRLASSVGPQTKGLRVQFWWGEHTSVAGLIPGFRAHAGGKQQMFLSLSLFLLLHISPRPPATKINEKKNILR